MYTYIYIHEADIQCWLVVCNCLGMGAEVIFGGWFPSNVARENHPFTVNFAIKIFVHGGFTIAMLPEGIRPWNCKKRAWKAMLALTISVFIQIIFLQYTGFAWDSPMNSGDGDTQHILRNWDCCLAGICWDVIPCRLTRCGIASILSSGKRLHNYGKSPCYHWVNPLFRLGHFQ